MATTADTAGHTEVELRNLKAVADVLEFWNKGDIDGIVEFYDEEIVWTNVALEEVYRGKGEVREFLARLFTALPDLQFAVHHKFADGDNIAERWTVQGTHLGTFMGIPATGRHVEINALSMVTMREGRFLTDQFYFDTGAVMRQMGLMPSLATSQGTLGRGFLWLAVKSMNVLSKAGRAGRGRRRAARGS
jgi:steroid delta-isomerase-like uncharacterized protein